MLRLPVTRPSRPTRAFEIPCAPAAHCGGCRYRQAPEGVARTAKPGPTVLESQGLEGAQCHVERPAVITERFIPFRRASIVTMCADDVPGEERESFQAWLERDVMDAGPEAFAVHATRVA